MNKNYQKVAIFLVLIFLNIGKIKAQGIQTFQSIRFYHPTTQGQYVSLFPPSTITSYGLTLPATQGAVNTMLLNDGVGNLSFNDGDGLFWRLGGNSQTVQNFGTKTNVDIPFITNNTEKMRLFNNGNLALGSTTTSFKLDVNGTGLFRSGNSAGLFSSDQLLFSFNATDQYRHAIKTRHNAGATTDNALDFYVWKFGTDAVGATGTQHIMTLQGNNNGSVGIGTTNPQNILHINNLSAAGDAIKISNAASGSTTADGFDMNHVGLTTNFILNQKENAELRFATNNIQRSTFMGDGRYAIGPNFGAPDQGFHYRWNNAVFEADDDQTMGTSGFLALGNKNDAAYELRFLEPNGNGINYSAFKNPILSKDIVYTLPSMEPSVNQVLQAGVVTGTNPVSVSLNWITPITGAGSAVTGNGTIGEVAFWSSPTNLASDSKMFWDNSTKRLGLNRMNPTELLEVSGNVLISNGMVGASKLKFGEPNYSTGDNYTSFEAVGQSENLEYRLPSNRPVSSANGSNRFVMLTDDASTTPSLSWQSVWTTQGNAGVSAGFLGTTDAQPLIFRANNTERARISSAGQTLIGLNSDYTDPISGTSSLAVAGGSGTRFSVSNSGNWMQYTNGTSTALIGHFSGNDFVTGTFSNHDYLVRTNNGERMRITNTGNVGIGITAPTNPLHLASGAFCTAAGVFTNASDARLKQNIKPIAYGLKDIMLLKPVSYEMKSNGEKQVGFIAQDIQKTLPELVSGKEGDLEKGETLGMSYGNLTAILTRAIQEQQMNIENLEDKNKLLSQQIVDLQKQLLQQGEQNTKAIDEIKAMLSKHK